MQVQPYLFFDGRCEEALGFYEKTLGAKIEMKMRFGEAPPEPSVPAEGCAGPPGDPNKIMHASVKVGDSIIMASDGMCTGKPEFRGVSLSLNFKNEVDAKRQFDALSADGQIQMPFAKTFFSPGFGMVADKFGVSWMIVVDQ